MSKNDKEERDQETEELNEMPDEEVPGEEAGVQACSSEEHAEEEAGESPVDAMLVLNTVDELFAPGIEELDITYGINALENHRVWLEIIGKDYPGGKVYQYDLNATEKTSGQNKMLKWDGKGNQGGELNGKWISPAFSPYKVVLAADVGLTDEGETKVEVARIELVADAPDDRMMMNDPDEEVLVTSKVWIKMKSAGMAVTPIESEVTYSFAADGGNENSAGSFVYSGSKTLGKAGNADAVYWADHPDSVSSSDDSYKTKCKVKTITSPGADQGLAKIWFKPSGVGGNKYKIKSEVFAANGTTSLANEETNNLVIWRKIHYSNIYTMDGESYIDNATTYAEISPAYEPDAFVLYSRDAATTLDASLTVKYIGLYESGGGMKDWPDDFSPEKIEASAFQLRPTADELADYASDDAAKKAAAKTAIRAKAQLWFDAIVADYSSCVSNWFTDAGVPGGNSLLAVQYYHPKLSGQGDGATDFWPPGLSINLANPGSGRDDQGDPDKATWRVVAGFNQGAIAVIFKNYPDAADLQNTCRHEIGHATKGVFKRAEFGGGDHSASGLMKYNGGGVNTFSNADIKILRGFKA